MAQTFNKTATTKKEKPFSFLLLLLLLPCELLLAKVTRAAASEHCWAYLIDIFRWVCSPLVAVAEVTGANCLAQVYMHSARLPCLLTILTTSEEKCKIHKIGITYVSLHFYIVTLTSFSRGPDLIHLYCFFKFKKRFSGWYMDPREIQCTILSTCLLFYKNKKKELCRGTCSTGIRVSGASLRDGKYDICTNLDKKYASSKANLLILFF